LERVYSSDKQEEVEEEKEEDIGEIYNGGICG